MCFLRYLGRQILQDSGWYPNGDRNQLTSTPVTQDQNDTIGLDSLFIYTQMEVPAGSDPASPG